MGKAFTAFIITIFNFPSVAHTFLIGSDNQVHTLNTKQSVSTQKHRNPSLISHHFFLQGAAGIFLVFSLMQPSHSHIKDTSEQQANFVNSFTEVNTSEDRIPVRMGFIVFPPLAHLDEQQQCFGSLIEKIQRIFPSERFNIDMYCATPARVYRDIKNGSIDLTINIKSTRRLQQEVLFSNQPIVELEVDLVGRDLASARSISSIGNFDYHGFRTRLEQQGKVFVNQSNSREAVAVFLRGDADALLSYRLPFEFYTKELQSNYSKAFESEKFEVLTLTKVGSHIAINRRSPYADILLKQVNASLK